MKSSYTFRYATLIALGYLLASVFTNPLLDLTETVEATSSCPPLDPSVKGWPKGTVVYYNISAFPPDIQTKLQQGFQKWSTANGTNGSGVSFTPADASHPATYVV